MRITSWLSLTLAAAALAACATKPPPRAAACADTFATINQTQDALKVLFHDRKGVHLLVDTHTDRPNGDRVEEMRVWPLSGPQEPAPPQRARLTIQACSAKVLSAERLSD